MEVRKLSGGFFIVMGLVSIAQAVYLRVTGGYEAGPRLAFVTAVFFTAGAAFLCGAKRRTSRSRRPS